MNMNEFIISHSMTQDFNSVNEIEVSVMVFSINKVFIEFSQSAV